MDSVGQLESKYVKLKNETFQAQSGDTSLLI